ncbi:PAS domain-containing sensor histidine kinase [[Phormidium] sp. ETS-05]|uniref:PAS domain-containing sensor histidine kinase n=1 Tax=[Phormidium] sp. ETS-05 TaxID=222819 RepID=UPI0018EF1054|nr:PAS domain-containing sensor histidine kinase [[Phormidium] sp. ETS-05]
MSFQTFALSGERQNSGQAAMTADFSGKVENENPAISETRFLGKLERRLAQEEKAETSQKHRQIDWSGIFQRLSHNVWVLSPTGIILEANQALKLANQELARVRGCRFWETGWCSPATAVEVIKAIAAGVVGNSWRGQILIPGADGTEVILDFQIQPILDDSGKVVQLLAEGYELGRRISKQRPKTHSRTGTPKKDAVRSAIVPENREIVTAKSIDKLDRGLIAPKEPITQATTDLCTCVPEPGFQSRSELEQSLSLLQATLNAQPDGILAFNLQGIVTAVNPGVGRIWQLGEAALEIRDLNQWLSLLANQCGDEAASRLQIEKLMAETSSEGAKEIITLKDGRLLEHQCHPLRVNQRLVGQVWTFKEIEECSREEEERSQGDTSARGALTKEADLSAERSPSDVGIASPLVQQSQFISMLCHEFRKPLNTISLAVSALQNYGSRWGEEKKSQYMQRIHNAVYQVDRLLNDILTIGRADAQMVQCHPQPLNVKSFCRDLITEIELETGQRHPNNPKRSASILFTGNIAQADSAAIFHLDEHFLKSILTNLLDNALKYSTPGSPVTLEVNTQGEEVIFRVQDQGIGIPKADRQTVCQPFHRAHNVGDIAGFGIGLAVVQKFVTIHGGQLTWTSKEGKGSTFVVKLPITQPAERIPPGAALASLPIQATASVGKCHQFGEYPA